MDTIKYNDLINSVVETQDPIKQKEFIIDLMNLAYTEGQIVGFTKATENALNIISPNDKPKQSK